VRGVLAKHAVHAMLHAQGHVISSMVRSGLMDGKRGEALLLDVISDSHKVEAKRKLHSRYSTQFLAVTKS
jgi:hypothetical protein